MTLFGIVLLLVVGATSVYVFRRGAKVLGLGRRGRAVLASALVVAPLAVAAGRILERTGRPTLAFALGAAGATVVLGVLISTVLLWAVDLPFGALGWLRRRRETKTSAPRAPGEAPIERETLGEVAGPRTIGRREVIRRTATGAALSVGFGSALYGVVLGRHDYEVNVVPVPVAGLSPRLDGYRIAQLSDVHFGVFVGERELASAVELVRKARPDLVVLTGDLVDHDAAFAPLLGRLVRRLSELGARDGVAVIPGNHDYYAGIEHVLDAARRGGARVLRNDGRVIGDAGGAFALLGVDDVWSPRNGYGPGPDLARAIAMVPRDLPRVLLCHNPELFPDARGHVALQLSGHTHGGQVNLGVRPADLVLPYVEGLYEENGTHLYVNRGFGTAGPPARVGAPPEVTLVVLTAA
ncbi:MAG TPA: metallophosphoesterase [Sandaracinaceae bacterium]